MQSIDRYMARLIAVPLFSTLIIAAMLLVLDRMLRLFDFVAAEGGPVSVVWRMLANLLPEYMGLGIPIGMLLGTLLAFRKLATSSELDVMRAVGMGYGRLLRVPYFFAIGLALLNLLIVGWVQPWSRYNYEELRFDLRSGALGASIKVGEFTTFPGNITVRIEESADKGTRLSGIFAQMRQDNDRWMAVAAERGQFLATEDKETILFRLTNGTLLHYEPGFTEPRVLTFSQHDLPIPLPKSENFRGRGGRNLERTLPELIRVGLDPKADPDDRNASWANLHFRLVEVVTMFLLPLLALALGVPPKRSTSALGVFVSIVMIVTQHKINEYGEDFGALGRVDPVLALWGPFVVFALLVGWMYYTIAYVPGGQPIGALERVFGKAGKALGRLIPGRRKAAA
ncbi:LPS export ABC transporter permease LptF [Sphingomonas sp. BGYR3]|uniref:LPS export ABC transporter permease LptF n=1 Tax=Sphingomonas sp. BGYR3 TaxID=2975483 RepID=UPI0021A485D0|nr:LPS export ABC transporter permease LptF [Sphingomonas sp. BGYR3]MDG5489831.1 LPS export ABC transporter permease LptF [Sphingomonas sp. BGYR3]